METVEAVEEMDVFDARDEVREGVVEAAWGLSVRGRFQAEGTTIAEPGADVVKAEALPFPFPFMILLLALLLLPPLLVTPAQLIPLLDTVDATDAGRLTSGAISTWERPE